MIPERLPPITSAGEESDLRKICGLAKNCGTGLVQIAPTAASLAFKLNEPQKKPENDMFSVHFPSFSPYRWSVRFSAGRQQLNNDKSHRFDASVLQYSSVKHSANRAG